MWTRSKPIYSSSLQLHPSSRITYSSHHKCDIEASPNSLIEFWVYDFWRNLSRARQRRCSLHHGKMTIREDWVFVTLIWNGNLLFVPSFAIRPLKSLLGGGAHTLFLSGSLFIPLYQIDHSFIFCYLFVPLNWKLLINIKY